METLSLLWVPTHLGGHLRVAFQRGIETPLILGQNSDGLTSPCFVWTLTGCAVSLWRWISHRSARLCLLPPPLRNSRGVISLLPRCPFRRGLSVWPRSQIVHSTVLALWPLLGVQTLAGSAHAKCISRCPRPTSRDRLACCEGAFHVYPPARCAHSSLAV